MPPCCTAVEHFHFPQIESECCASKRTEFEDLSLVPPQWLQLTLPSLQDSCEWNSASSNSRHGSTRPQTFSSLGITHDLASLSESCLKRICYFLPVQDRISFSLCCKDICHAVSLTVNRLRLNDSLQSISFLRVLQRFADVKIIESSLDNGGFPLKKHHIQQLCQSRLQLESLTLDKQRTVTNHSLVMIAKSFPCLEFLSLNGCPNAGSAGIMAISQHCRWLKSVHISDCRSVTSEALTALSENCLELEVLEISEASGFSGVWGRLRHLTVSCDANECKIIPGDTNTECPSLESLKLRFCCGIDKINFIERHSRSIKLLILESCASVSQSLFRKEWPSLEGLFVQSSDITDSTLQSISNSCRRLTSLTLQSCGEISDYGLSVLISSCQGLKYLDVRQSPHITHTEIVEYATGKAPSLLQIVLPRQCFGRIHLNSVSKHGWQLDPSSSKLLLVRNCPCSCMSCLTSGKGQC